MKIDLSKIPVLILMLFSSICVAQKDNAEQEINVKLTYNWFLAGIYDEAGNLVKDDSKSVELNIAPDEKTFSGNTGCNAMRGPLLADKSGAIKLGPVESMRTKRCANAEKEKKILEMLDCVSRYRIEGKQLVLFCDEKPRLLFERH